MAIEHYLEMLRRERKLSPIIIRPANPYGPRQAHVGIQGVVTTFMTRALKGEPIEIWGDGTVVRDFLHVEDLAGLCVTATASAEEGPFNAGSGEGVTLNALIEAIEFAAEGKPARSVDVPRSILDITRTTNAFGWKAQIALQDGLKTIRPG